MSAEEWCIQITMKEVQSSEDERLSASAYWASTEERLSYNSKAWAISIANMVEAICENAKQMMMWLTYEENGRMRREVWYWSDPNTSNKIVKSRF